MKNYSIISEWCISSFSQSWFRRRSHGTQSRMVEGRMARPWMIISFTLQTLIFLLCMKAILLFKVKAQAPRLPILLLKVIIHLRFLLLLLCWGDGFLVMMFYFIGNLLSWGSQWTFWVDEWCYDWRQGKWQLYPTKSHAWPLGRVIEWLFV